LAYSSFADGTLNPTHLDLPLVDGDYKVEKWPFLPVYREWRDDNTTMILHVPEYVQ
jgi:hypothetical protein